MVWTPQRPLQGTKSLSVPRISTDPTERGPASCLCVLVCCTQGKLIGQGSFGSVYLGIDLHTGKEVCAHQHQHLLPQGVGGCQLQQQFQAASDAACWGRAPETCGSTVLCFMCVVQQKCPSQPAGSALSVIIQRADPALFLHAGGHQGHAKAARQAVAGPDAAKAGQGGGWGCVSTTAVAAAASGCPQGGLGCVRTQQLGDAAARLAAPLFAWSHTACTTPSCSFMCALLHLPSPQHSSLTR